MVPGTAEHCSMCFHRLPWFSLWFFREKCKKVKFQSLRQPYSGMYLHFILYEIGIWSESLKDHQFTFGSQILAHLKKKSWHCSLPKLKPLLLLILLLEGGCSASQAGRGGAGPTPEPAAHRCLTSSLPSWNQIMSGITARNFFRKEVCGEKRQMGMSWESL